VTMRRATLFISIHILIGAVLTAGGPDSASRAPRGYAVLRSLRPFSEAQMPDYPRPKIGLVLSGGGSRGLAQLGVVKALEESGLRPDVIAGTSIGAIVGGLYAAGYSTEALEREVKSIDWDELFRFGGGSRRENIPVDQKPVSDRSILTVRFDGLRPVLPLAVSNGQRLTNLLSDLVLRGVYHTATFDDLKVAFRAVCTDLYTGRLVVLKSGNLAEALRASSTIPVLFSPIQKDGMALVDGGHAANIPVDVLSEEDCDIIIAVNTTSGNRTPDQIGNPLDMLDQVLNLLMERPNTDQLSRADLVIEPALGNRLATDFTEPDSVIEEGYSACKAAIPRIMELLRRCGKGYGRDDDTTGGERAELAPVAARLENIRIDGASPAFEIRIIGEISRYLDRLMTASCIRELCEDAIGVYRDHGYALARIDSLEIDRHGGAIGLRISEGIIAEVEVEGITRTNSVVILRELPVAAGRIFRLDDARRGLNNITGLDLFHHVGISIQEEGRHPRLIVRVEERPSQLLRLNTLIDNERNAQIGFELQDANLFGSGTQLSGLITWGFDNRRYEARYATNRLFYTNLSFTAQAYYDLRDFNVFQDLPGLPRSRYERGIAAVVRQVEYGAAASVGLYAGRFGNLAGTLRIEEQSLGASSIIIDGAPDIMERQRIVSLAASTTIDTQDRYPYPREGMLLLLSYTSAQEALGSARTFSKFSARYEVYISDVIGRITIIPKLQFGYGDRTMPRTEDFRLGGLYSFIGMRENEFSGRQLLLGSIEARYKAPFDILFDTYFSLRYNLGRTWEIPEQIKFDDLRHGAGICVGLDTPIGPADFGIGRGFIFMENAKPLIRWGPLNMYFSIGVSM